jgi:hypothetical protein
MALTENMGGGDAPAEFIEDGRSAVLRCSQTWAVEDNEISEVLWSGRSYCVHGREKRGRW